MKLEILKLSAVFLFCFGLTSVQAQETISATGGEASGNGGSASYSVGQVVYTTNTGTTGSVAQGVQQAYEISVVSGIEQAKDIMLECKAYPNPTTDYLTLKVDASTTLSIQSLSYQLFDISGKLLKSKKITSNETEIEMINLVPATYFLKVITNQQKVKTFKIIKTQ